MRSRWSFLGVGLAFALGALVPANASAAMVYTLTQSNTNSIGPDGGNYGTVTLVQVDANTVNLVLTINPGRAGDEFLEFGFNSVLALTAANITSAPPGWLPPTSTNQDGFGNFDLVVGSSQQSERVSTATIVVTRTGGLTINNFLKSSGGGAESPFPNGAYFAAHLAPGGGGATGYVGALSGDLVPPSLATPEPTTIAIAMSSLIPLGLMGLRRFRRRASAA